MKKLTALLLTFILCFQLGALSVLALEPAGIQVGSRISVDTTWTKAGSPYYVNYGLSVDEGVTLTIESGAEIIIGSDSDVEINGLLHAVGSKTEQITFVRDAQGNTEYKALTFNSDNNILQDCSFDSFNVVVYGSNNTIDNCSLTNGMIALGDYGENSDNNIVKNCTVSDATSGVALFYSSGNQLIGNEILNCSTGIVIDSCDNNFIDNNYIHYNSLPNNQIKGIYFNNSAKSNIIQNCKIENNYTGVYFSSGEFSENHIIKNEFYKNNYAIYLKSDNTSEIQYNNFIDTATLNLYSLSTVDVNVPNNYWGTTDTALIDDSIFDPSDQTGIGKVNYQPILTAPYGIEIAGANQPSGEYVDPINVELTAAEGCIIYYTLDGSDPRDAGKIQYTAAIPISVSTVLKTVSYKDGNYSMVSWYTYTFVPPAKPFSIDLITLTDENQNEIFAIPQDGSFIVKVDVTKNISYEKYPFVFLVTYTQEGKYIGCKELIGKLTLGQKETLDTKLDNSSDIKIGKIKAFVWKDPFSLSPLAVSKVYAPDLIKIAEDAPLFIVKGVGQDVSTDNKIVRVLTGYYAGDENLRTFQFSSDGQDRITKISGYTPGNDTAKGLFNETSASVDELQSGSIISMTLDSNDQISTARIVYNKNSALDITSGYYEGLDTVEDDSVKQGGYILGEVYTKDNGTRTIGIGPIGITPTGPVEDTCNIFLKAYGCKFGSYDYTWNRASTEVTFADIDKYSSEFNERGSIVLVKTYGDILTDILILR